MTAAELQIVDVFKYVGYDCIGCKINHMHMIYYDECNKCWYHHCPYIISDVLVALLSTEEILQKIPLTSDWPKCAYLRIFNFEEEYI